MNAATVCGVTLLMVAAMLGLSALAMKKNGTEAAAVLGALAAIFAAIAGVVTAMSQFLQV